MAYLKNKIITLLLFLAPLVSYGQWTYTFTDPCTLTQQTIQMGSSNSIALNYFGNVQTFTQDDFTNGTFDSWMDLVSQANSTSPCESVSQVIQNTTSSIVVQNTIGVITNIMGVLGGDMIPQAISASSVPVAEAIDNAAGEDEEGEGGNNSSQSGSSGSQSSSQSGSSSSSGSQSGESGGSGTSSGQSSGSGSSQTSGGQGNTGGSGTSTGGAENGTEEESKEGAMTMSLANSVSNAIDGGDGSAEANKNSGSLIASGDIVVIDNRDNSNGRQVKVVGSITHANTKQNKIQGALFTYTTVTNDFSLTLYKSWINPKRTFNLVACKYYYDGFQSKSSKYNYST